MNHLENAVNSSEKPALFMCIEKSLLTASQNAHITRKQEKRLIEEEEVEEVGV